MNCLPKIGPLLMILLATCCIEWENAVDEGQQFGLRILKFRTGVVLDYRRRGFAAVGLAGKAGFRFAVGQWHYNGFPWIHHQDVVDMYMFGLDNDLLTGVYNMAAPHTGYQ
jgi:NAD dependent epimerase/dehydratase family enzyme